VIGGEGVNALSNRGIRYCCQSVRPSVCRVGLHGVAKSFASQIQEILSIKWSKNAKISQTQKLQNNRQNFVNQSNIVSCISGSYALSDHKITLPDRNM